MLRTVGPAIVEAAASGLSIAYHPKPKVRELAMISIMSGGMDRALELLRC